MYSFYWNLFSKILPNFWKALISIYPSVYLAIWFFLIVLSQRTEILDRVFIKLSVCDKTRIGYDNIVKTTKQSWKRQKLLCYIWFKGWKIVTFFSLLQLNFNFRKTFLHWWKCQSILKPFFNWFCVKENQILWTLYFFQYVL